MSKKHVTRKCLCGKQGFADADEAQDTLDRWHERMVSRRAPKVPQRIYECTRQPGTWHITSQEFQHPLLDHQPKRQPGPSFRESPKSKQRRKYR